MTSTEEYRRPAWLQAAAVALLAAAIAIWIAVRIMPQKAVLFGIAILLGIALKHAAFGFTAQWRRFLLLGDGRGIRAQMVMLALASGLRLGHSLCPGRRLHPHARGSAILPDRLALGLRASAMVVRHALVRFRLPAGEDGHMAGHHPAVAAVRDDLRTGNMDRETSRLRASPAGGIALALLNFATLAVSGHPWTISFGYTLWGGKIARMLGFDLTEVAFWTWPYPARALAGPWLAEDTSLMNLGIILGAALAAALSGGIGPLRPISWRAALGAALGGLLMGYGARIAFGCNVGAYFSGIATGSLHGWEWLIFGMLGTWAGIRLRPYFDLPNP